MPIFGIRWGYVGKALFSTSHVAWKGQTLTEKIVQKFTVGCKPSRIHPGDFVSVSPAYCMTHDNTWPVVKKFKAIGATKIFNEEQCVITLDHDVQNRSRANMEKYERIEQFARQHNLDFYPAGHGIGHQIMIEEGYAWPYTMVVASDSHSNMYGGVGCLGTAVVRTDAASIWTTGETWWQMPPIVKVELTGNLMPGVSGKDVIVALCGLFSHDQVLNHAVEFHGSLNSLSVDDRLAIANMTTEWGALSGLFPIDKTLVNWLHTKVSQATLSNTAPSTARPTQERINSSRLTELLQNIPRSDPDANFAKTLTLDLSRLTPFVAGPNSVKLSTPLPVLEALNIQIDKAYLISCTNSRRSDLAAAAEVFRQASQRNNKPAHIAPHVKLYVAAASQLEQLASEKSGDWDILMKAGAKPLPSGCGPCIGLGEGLLKDGEVGISASNRNFKGRMGSSKAQAYLASPSIVASSALNGYISGSQTFNCHFPKSSTSESDFSYLGKYFGCSVKVEPELGGALRNKIDGERASDAVQNHSQTGNSSNFPPSIAGEILFCDADNINTDAIYPGEFTYQDSLGMDEMAKIAMRNYDTKFHDLVKPGDILVSGYNFGCGSSREQAATALLAAGIPLLLAGSFSHTFARNSVNNGLIFFNLPQLLTFLRRKFPSSIHQSTRRTGYTLTWNVATGNITVNSTGQSPVWSSFVPTLPSTLQQIIAHKGLEAWIQSKINCNN